MNTAGWRLKEAYGPMEKLISSCRKWEAELAGMSGRVSQKGLADAWNVAEITISQYKTGRRQIPLSRLIWVKERYGKSWTTIGKLIEADSQEWSG